MAVAPDEPFPALEHTWFVERETVEAKESRWEDWRRGREERCKV